MSLTIFFMIIWNSRFCGTYFRQFWDFVYAIRFQKATLEGIGKKKWYEKVAKIFFLCRFFLETYNYWSHHFFVRQCKLIQFFWYGLQTFIDVFFASSNILPTHDISEWPSLVLDFTAPTVDIYRNMNMQSEV